MVLVLHCFASHLFYASHAWHIFTRVASNTEASYELVAEPIQEPPAEEQQIEEVVEQAPEDVANPADLQGKPRSITFILNLYNVSDYVLVH